MIKVNAIGDTCPIPIVKAKQAIKELNGAGEVEILVDNEIAVQNLMKMAKQKNYAAKAEKIEGDCYKVVLTVNAAEAPLEGQNISVGGNRATEKTSEDNVDMSVTCGIRQERKKKTVIAISSSKMGEGNEELGGVLMKGFLYAITQQEELPETILFYNGGAVLTCGEHGTEAEMAIIEDLKTLEAQGVEILTCGTCLNYYGLTDKLQVGDVTNMYVIAEKLTQADLVVKP